MAPMTPEHAAKVVVTKTRETASGLADKTEPPLKPYQPNQSRKTPIDAKGILWPGIGLIVPFLPYLPILGLNNLAPTNAAHPPTPCTKVEPAKS